MPAPTTFLEIQDHLMDLLDVDDTATRTFVKDYINFTARDIWLAHPWPERYAEATITTLSPYSTGTVASSGATITGTGTTFPATFTAALARFAASYASPFYTVSTRDSATQLTLSESYAETALSGSTYVYYQDIYNLASDVDELVDVRLLKAGQHGPIAAVLEKRLDEQAYIPGSAGTPIVYSMVGQSSAGLKRVRLWPVPDNVYRLKYRYLKGYTEMTADADECVIPESRRDLLIVGALRYGYRLKDEYAKAGQEEALFRRMLAEHWAREKDKAVLPARLAPFDGGSRRVDPWDISTMTIV